jgi:hypothetical protein
VEEEEQKTQLALRKLGFEPRPLIWSEMKQHVSRIDLLFVSFSAVLLCSILLSSRSILLNKTEFEGVLEIPILKRMRFFSLFCFFCLVLHLISSLPGFGS